MDKSTFYAYCSPISREVFEQFFVVISKAFASIFNEGLGVVAGPRVAGLMLKKVAVEMNVWDGPTGVEAGLINEIRRLSCVMMPDGSGWTMVPLQDAIDRKLLSPGDASEVENALAFLIVVSAMLRKTELAGVLGGAASLWDAQTTLLSATAYRGSLPTLTVVDSTGTKDEAVLSLPS